MAKFLRYLVLAQYFLLVLCCCTLCDKSAPQQNIENPLEVIDFGDGMTPNIEVKAKLGRILNQAQVQTVFFACSLLWNETTYLPIPRNCSKGNISSIEHMPGGKPSLYFVYGRPGDFTRTFLRLPAPNRYFSLGTLGSRVRYLDNKMTINLRVRSDNASEETLACSNADRRKSFIHKQVNITLTEALKRVNFSTGWLNGSIYISTSDIQNESQTAGLGFPLVFGKVYRFQECDRSLLPLNATLRDAYANRYNYTVCSSWRLLEGESNHVVDLWTGSAWMQLICISLAIIVGLVVFPLIIVQYNQPKEDNVFNKGRFPNSLSVRHAFMDKTCCCQCLSVILQFCPIPLFLFVFVVY